MSYYSRSSILHSIWRRATILLLLLLPFPILGLNQDGLLLLSFKYSILSDPLSALANWNYADSSPCSWNGVVCMGFPVATPSITITTITTTTTDNNGGSSVWFPTESRVISLVLPNAKLLGSIAPELGLVEHLRHIDLSGNVLNGTIPGTLFNASELRVLSLADNEISGEFPELAGPTGSLQVLNLSDNALTGRLPANLTLLPNLTVVSLANNYLCGDLPINGLYSLQVLDVSSNLFNGTLPPELGGRSLRYLNLSYNRIAGEVPAEIGLRLPAKATIDFSFNNLSGPIPQAGAFAAQKPAAFAGNPELCGRPLRKLCTIPSTLSNPPNGSALSSSESKSPPAFAVMPKNPSGDSSALGGEGEERRGGVRPTTILAIVAGDLGGVVLLFVLFLYAYQLRRKKKDEEKKKKKVERGVTKNPQPSAYSEAQTLGGALSCCLRMNSGNETEESSETSASSETEREEKEAQKKAKEEGNGHLKQKQEAAMLVTVDGESDLELETLLKASAYILGATGSSIVYKAVLADGTALAVRRIGETSGIDRLKDFDAQVRAIARFRHPNLLRLRAFYWGTDEKLLIHDYAPNGSLANISFSKKLGSSPFHLNWEARLRIMRGIARGLAYLHEKKCVHGNVKPSNILLGSDLEPVIGDLGLERLMPCDDGGLKPGASSWAFGSKRSMHSTNSLPDLSPLAAASPCGSSSNAAAAPPPYQAPESIKNLKPNAKWDVYSFGMVVLELISGRVFTEVELCQWNSGLVVEEKKRVLRMADPALRGEVLGKEEALLACFRLGFSCCVITPQKRPSMKDALQVIERIVASCSSY
ncbi:probable LRR receptor-like serine/threonine-protein kinase At4g37250 [Typha latifolia]|uniref:probable LRR receptor-like serine/threonine-protein kinase At4g37250 n=1 Tax=Typha latifolia TaxID=4733 RepID=UPI003C2AE50A